MTKMQAEIEVEFNSEGAPIRATLGGWEWSQGLVRPTDEEDCCKFVKGGDIVIVKNGTRYLMVMQ